MEQLTRGSLCPILSEMFRSVDRTPKAGSALIGVVSCSANFSRVVNILKSVDSGFGLLFSTFPSFIKQQRAVGQLFLSGFGNECLIKTPSPLIGWCFLGGKAAVSV